MATIHSHKPGTGVTKKDLLHFRRVVWENLWDFDTRITEHLFQLEIAPLPDGGKVIQNEKYWLACVSPEGAITLNHNKGISAFGDHLTHEERTSIYEEASRLAGRNTQLKERLTADEWKKQESLISNRLWKRMGRTHLRHGRTFHARLRQALPPHLLQLDYDLGLTFLGNAEQWINQHNEVVHILPYYQWLQQNHKSALWVFHAFWTHSHPKPDLPERVDQTLSWLRTHLKNNGLSKGGFSYLTHRDPIERSAWKVHMPHFSFNMVTPNEAQDDHFEFSETKVQSPSFPPSIFISPPNTLKKHQPVPPSKMSPLFLLANLLHLSSCKKPFFAVAALTEILHDLIHLSSREKQEVTPRFLKKYFSLWVHAVSTQPGVKNFSYNTIQKLPPSHKPNSLYLVLNENINLSQKQQLKNVKWIAQFQKANDTRILRDFKNINTGDYPRPTDEEYQEVISRLEIRELKKSLKRTAREQFFPSIAQKKRRRM